MRTIEPTLFPDATSQRLVAAAPGWREAVAAPAVARCQLYNTMEARVEWHPVQPDWDRLAVTDNGWRLPCRVDIPFYGTIITFDVLGRRRPELGAVELTIPADTLVERDGTFGRLLRLDLLPEFAAAPPGAEGYLLLPCLAGVLHHFTHQVSREERIAIYARQEQWAMKSNFNCLGSHQPGLSWCAIVTEGEFDAEAVVRSHYEEAARSSVHVGLVYRWEPNDPLLPGNRAVRYYLFDPTNGGWAAFARRYRRFLRAERGVRTWAEKAGDHPAVLRFARGFGMKIMQGYKQRTLDGRGKYCSCTSFPEARHLLQAMQDDGIRQLTVQMVGWNHEGHDGRYPTRFPVNPVEGGEAAFRELIAWSHQQGIIMSVHDNIYDSHEISEDFRRDELVVLRDGTPWRNIPWAGGLTYKLCPICALRIVERDLPRMKALGIDGNYYLDAVAAFHTCHAPEHPANRAEFLAAMRKLLVYTRRLFGTLSLEVAYGPYFDLMDGVYCDTPEFAKGLDAFTDFGRHFIDAVVPFLPIALHNSVRYACGNPRGGRHGALECLAWGGMPFLEISARPVPGAHAMPTYPQVRDYARAGYALCCEEHVALVERDLHAIESPAPDLYLTEYADGPRLLINASANPAEIDGRLIPSLHLQSDG